MRDLIVYSQDASDDDILLLARALADSGDRFDPDPYASDVPSTGGPSSLSTLLCPLFLRELGLRVPKIGVEGRPAGAIDVLGSIPGYRWDLDSVAAREVLVRTGYVHLSARRFAPLDGHLFALRKRANAIDNPPLAIASLLAKKLAAGVTRVVLDVRVAAFGNFGADFDQARTNAKRFNRIAGLAGIHATCFLTDAEQPYQPYIGRGEALIALDRVLRGNANPWLRSHVNMCKAMARLAAPTKLTDESAGEGIQSHFRSNLEAQGSSWGAFRSRVESLSTGTRQEITASTAGYVRVDLNGLRASLVEAQSEAKGSSFPDPAGVILTYEPWKPVEIGEVIALVRSGSRPDIASTIATKLRITDRPPRDLAPEVVAEPTPLVP